MGHGNELSAFLKISFDYTIMYRSAASLPANFSWSSTIKKYKAKITDNFPNACSAVTCEILVPKKSV